MNDVLKSKLANLPKEPGVYFHKDAAGDIIYVGKAAVLSNRVRQYFQKSRTRDPKTEALVSEIVDTDWMVVGSELEALFLEAEMVRRYMPRYNILLRDDKSLSYIRIDYDSDFPTVTTTRRPLDDGARYFGPYLSNYNIKVALKLLRRIFPYSTRKIPGQKRATLHYHIGLDPGLEQGKTTLTDYRANLRKLMAVIQGRRTEVIKQVEKEMKAASKSGDYEQAAKFRNQFFALQNLTKQVIFSDKEFLDISKDHALSELVDLLGLRNYPKRIEGYDISHMSGKDVVASMVVFTNGVSNKGEYRKFKTRQDHNNDFYNMQETLTRRLSQKNVRNWGMPDIFLIDGGKGQLGAALKARDDTGHSDSVFIGLAKREEQIVIRKANEVKSRKLKVKSGGSNVELNLQFLHKLGGFVTESDEFLLVNLPHNTNLVKLLQRIRDESHRFAISYHSTLKRQRQTTSILEDIPGIGPATKKKLLRHFGSLNLVLEAPHSEISQIIGPAKATQVKKFTN
jgi:excinuclease ABC subunit C